MSVRRRDENVFERLRAPIGHSKRAIRDENAQKSIGKGVETSQKASTSASTSTAPKTNATSSKSSNNIQRTALSSVSNSTPQQPKSTNSQSLTRKVNPQSQIKRTALSSKPSTGAQQPHLSSRNALVTPARKPNTKKALSVYTPAIPNQSRRGESDAVEYMPPRVKEAPVNIHEELGLRSGADDDLIRAGDTPPDLDFDLAPLESDQMYGPNDGLPFHSHS